MIPVGDIEGLHPVPSATQCTSNYPCFYPVGCTVDTVIPLISQATAGGSDHDARPALGVYLHRLRREIAAMDGPDLLVFTGGIGEPDPAVRAAAATGPGFLGVVIDQDSNSAAHGDGHGQRDPVRTSVRLAVTCSILPFSA